MPHKILKERNSLYSPHFSPNWEEHVLYDLADWLNGMAFRDFNFSPNGRPVVKIAEIKNGIGNQTKFTDAQYKEIYLLKKGDMLFCWSGQPETSIDAFWWNGPEGWLNQHIFKVAPKAESKLFFFYLLKYLKPHFVQIAINKQTTGLGHVTKGDLEKIIVKLPLPIEQKAIAAVLSSLDDKIELLREENKTLETLAQTIFKEWFVKFNFPDSKGKPYLALGGRMIDSPLGPIPEGWRVFYLEEIIETINGYSYKGKELKEAGEEALVTLKSFDRTGGFQVRGFKPFVGGNPKKQQEVLLGDLIVAHTDLTQDAEVLGNPAFIFDNGGYKKMYITMDLVKIIPKKEDITLGFFYYLMSTNSFKKHCIGYANGTTVLHLSKKAITEYQIALPENLLLVKEFSKIARATTLKTISNFSQIKTLSTLRDSFLPKLMKGEIRVKEFTP
ncbi:restriction endonuclease subunit S [Patescibacteria group bacterium]|nr:restriction endonuclease subunit S [Patescibacteria group bacterium]